MDNLCATPSHSTQCIHHTELGGWWWTVAKSSCLLGCLVSHLWWMLSFFLFFPFLVEQWGCGILVPWPDIKQAPPPPEEARVLTTGLPGTSRWMLSWWVLTCDRKTFTLQDYFYMSIHISSSGLLVHNLSLFVFSSPWPDYQASSDYVYSHLLIPQKVDDQMDCLNLCPLEGSLLTTIF